VAIDQSSRPVQVIEPRRTGIVGPVVSVWTYRHLIPHFGWQFLRKRYARTVLGKSWLVIRPVFDIGGQALVFGGILGVATGELPYPVVFSIALSAWMFFSQAAYWSTRSLELARRELRLIYIPRLVPLLATLIPSFIVALIYGTIAGLIVIGYLVADGTFYLDLGIETLLVVPGLVLIAVLGLGIGLWTAPFTARYRDLRFGLVYALGFIYFLTPVIYPLDAIPDRFRTLASLNPLTAPIGMIKRGLLGVGDIPPEAVGVSIAGAVVIVGAGLIFFLRHESTAVDDL
jgi:lipopolysaccharide transport system permease protein